MRAPPPALPIPPRPSHLPRPPAALLTAPPAPSRDTSAIVSLVLFLATLGGVFYFADLLASTSQLTLVGGFVSSLLFFFGLTVRSA